MKSSIKLGGWVGIALGVLMSCAVGRVWSASSAESYPAPPARPSILERSADAPTHSVPFRPPRPGSARFDLEDEVTVAYRS